MVRIIVLAAAMVAACPAFAADGFMPDRPCAELQAQVSTAGAVVLHTSPYVYDRYVRDGTFCPPHDDLKMAFVRARDQRACFVGYTCKVWSNQRM